MYSIIITTDGYRQFKQVKKLLLQKFPHFKIVSCSQLAEAIQKLSEGGNMIIYLDELPGTKSKLKTECPEFIELSDMSGKRTVATKNIMRIEAERNYSTFFFADKSSVVMSKPINYYERLLCGTVFSRSHNSHLVNMAYIKKIEKHVGGRVQLSDNTFVPVSRSRKQALKKNLYLFKKPVGAEN